MKKRTVIIAVVAVIVAAIGVGITVYVLRGGAALAVNATELSVGEKYLAELNYEQATATLQRVIVVEPNNTEAYLALSKAYNYMGDIDTARETLENGLNATNSAVIERELSAMANEALTFTSNSYASSTESITMVKIAGQFYQSDITELVLRNCGLTNADMQKLADFTNLERLDISYNGISDISSVGNLPTLKKFYASNNTIADVSTLANMPLIEYIGLRGNQITNADSLFALGSLKYLHLSENQITQILSIGENLQLLYLADNKISNADAITGRNLLYYDISGNAGR